MRRALLPLVMALFVLSRPEVARADEPQPVHRYADDRLPPPSARTKLLLVGAGVTTAFYLPVLGASYIWSDAAGAAESRIPVAGPWMQLTKTKTCARDPDAPASCNDFGRIFGAILLALDGIGQAGGVAIMAQSLFIRTAPRGSSAALHTPGPSYSSIAHRRRFLTYRSGDFEVSARPTSLPGADFALGVVGKF